MNEFVNDDLVYVINKWGLTEVLPPILFGFDPSVELQLRDDNTAIILINGVPV